MDECKPLLSDRSAKCKVCWDQPLEVLLRPCRHVALCQLCTPRMPRCPVCNGAIQGTERVYV